MNKPVYLSVVIPAYNEAANFSRGTLGQVTDYLSSQKYEWEVIVVNDGSTDSTLSKLNEYARSHPGVKVIDAPHQGKAATIMTGAKNAAGKYILFTDMDQATPLKEVEKLLGRLEEGSDIVIGSRANRQGAPLYRQVLAYGMVFMRTVLLRLPYKDTQCGFKAFTRESAGKIFSILSPLRMGKSTLSGAAVNPGFDVEILYIGRKLGYKISEVPVEWHHFKSNRVRFFRDAISGIRELLLVRWRSLTNSYNLNHA